MNFISKLKWHAIRMKFPPTHPFYPPRPSPLIVSHYLCLSLKVVCKLACVASRNHNFKIKFLIKIFSTFSISQQWYRIHVECVVFFVVLFLSPAHSPYFSYERKSLHSYTCFMFCLFYSHSWSVSFSSILSAIYCLPIRSVGLVCCVSVCLSIPFGIEIMKIYTEMRRDNNAVDLYVR